MGCVRGRGENFFLMRFLKTTASSSCVHIFQKKSHRCLKMHLHAHTKIRRGGKVGKVGGWRGKNSASFFLKRESIKATHHRAILLFGEKGERNFETSFFQNIQEPKGLSHQTFVFAMKTL